MLFLTGLCRYEKEGRLTVTDHFRNFSRTYEDTTTVIPAFLTTDFEASDHVYVGGLPVGVLVSHNSFLTRKMAVWHFRVVGVNCISLLRSIFRFLLNIFVLIPLHNAGMYFACCYSLHSTINHEIAVMKMAKFHQHTTTH